MPQIHPQNSPFTFDDHHPPLIHPSLDRPHSPFPMASGSSQPSCHSTLSGQTDRPTNRPTHTQTDRWDRQQVYTISAYTCYIDGERRTKMIVTSVFVMHVRPCMRIQAAIWGGGRTSSDPWQHAWCHRCTKAATSILYQLDAQRSMLFQFGLIPWEGNP